MDPKAVDQFLKNKVQDLKEEKRQEQMIGTFIALSSAFIDKVSETITEAFGKVKIDAPQVPDIIIPTINIPEIKVPTINIPEIKVPTINVPAPQVTVNVPEKDMVETNKLLKAILNKEPKDESMDISVNLKIV